MTTDGDGPERFVESIRQSGLTIYDAIAIGDPELWIPTPELEALLNAVYVEPARLAALKSARAEATSEEDEPD